MWGALLFDQLDLGPWPLRIGLLWGRWGRVLLFGLAQFRGRFVVGTGAILLARVVDPHPSIVVVLLVSALDPVVSSAAR